VKVQRWVNGKEGDEFVGVGARFGPKIVSKEKHANRTKLTLADPIECCSPPKDKVYFLELEITIFVCPRTSVSRQFKLQRFFFLLVIGFWRCSFSSKGQVQIHKESKVC
jgi:hypothetical protein